MTAGNYKNVGNTLQFRGTALGRPCHIVVDNSDGIAEAAISAALDELHRLEVKFAAKHPKSIVYAVNQSAGSGQVIPIDAETRSLFSLIALIRDETHQRFDPTLQMESALYGDTAVSEQTSERARQVAAATGYSNINVSSEGVALASPATLLDLDSTVRPYALDCAVRALRAAGAVSALLDLSRDAAAIGRQGDHSNWLHGIRFPKGRSSAVARTKINDAALSMRGNYERPLILQNARHGRAIHPDTGQPIDGLLSVAIRSEKVLDAYTAATIARLKSEADALEWLNTLDMPWFAIDCELQCHGTMKLS